MSLSCHQLRCIYMAYSCSYRAYFMCGNRTEYQQLFKAVCTRLERVTREAFTHHGWQHNLWIGAPSPSPKAYRRSYMILLLLIWHLFLSSFSLFLFGCVHLSYAEARRCSSCFVSTWCYILSQWKFPLSKKIHGNDYPWNSVTASLVFFSLFIYCCPVYFILLFSNLVECDKLDWSIGTGCSIQVC